MLTNSRTFLQRALALVALMIVAGTTALAQSPFSTPQRLSAEVSPTSGGYNVYLTWGWFRQNQGGMSELPDGFKIYRAEGIDSSNTGGLDFELVATVSYADAGDSANSNGGFFRHVDQVSEGYYTYYVVAYGANGAVSAPSNWATASARPAPPTITIANGYQVGADAIVGQPFTYDVNATASNGGAVRYRIVYASGGANTPDTLGDAVNATVDSITGIISWTPAGKGAYGQATLAIEAYLQGQEAVYSVLYLTIRIRSCASGAVITGRIVDEQGNPLQTPVVVGAYEVLGNGQLTRRGYDTVTNGAYSLFVDAGTYVVKADGRGIVNEWYNDAATSDAAERLTLQCQDTQVVNMAVKVRIPEQYFSISGVVTDQETGNALPGILTAVGYDRELPPDQAARNPLVYTNYAMQQGATSATYSFSTPKLGCVMRWVMRPSLVSNSSPSVSASSRPTGKTRGSGGTSPTTTGRPCVSLADDRTPMGLCST